MERIEQRNCLQCGKGFTPRPDHIRRGFGFYCSRSCHYEHRRSLPPADFRPRFWSKVNKDGPLWSGTHCWPWTACRNAAGYGRFALPRKGGTSAYRVAYELIKGPVPDGLELDHLCRNHSCVNPDHLEAVTPKVNLLRGVGYAATNAAKTHCIRGHEFTEENIYRDSEGFRQCRECRKILRAAFMARHPGYMKARRDKTRAATA